MSDLRDSRPLEGQVALITGAGRGIGKGIAAALAQSGASVALVSRSASELAEAAEQVQRLGVESCELVGDITDPAQVEALFAECVERLGRLDILVNNAGTIRIRSILDHDLEAWDSVFAVNTRAVFLCSQAAARIMAAAGTGGRIIMISSHYAAEAHEGAMAYCASKAAVESMAANLALELAPHKITVNSIRVGSVPSTLLSDEKSREQREHIWENLQAQGVLRPQPVWGRKGTPQDIGAVAAFLASPAAEWVTGAVIYADGGTHLRTMLT